MKSKNTQLGHEKLIRRSTNISNVQRYIFILVLAYILTVHISTDIKFLNLLLWTIGSVLIFTNIVTSFKKIKIFEIFADTPMNLISSTIDLLAGISMGVVFFGVITPISIFKSLSQKTLLNNKGWIDVSYKKNNFEEGF
jgi:hypothetical protein